MTELDEQIATYAERCIRPALEALAKGLGPGASPDVLSRLALRAGLIPSFARWQETEGKKAAADALFTKALYSGGVAAAEELALRSSLARASAPSEARGTSEGAAPERDDVARTVGRAHGALPPAEGAKVDEQAWAQLCDDVSRKKLPLDAFTAVCSLLKNFKVEGKWLSEQLPNIRSDGLRARVLEIAKAKGWA